MPLPHMTQVLAIGGSWDGEGWESPCRVRNLKYARIILVNIAKYNEHAPCRFKRKGTKPTLHITKTIVGNN